MAKYKALRTTWLSGECRLVQPGDEFEATFPEHMKLGDNLELVVDKPADDEKPKPKVDKTKG